MSPWRFEFDNFEIHLRADARPPYLAVFVGRAIRLDGTETLTIPMKLWFDSLAEGGPYVSEPDGPEPEMFDSLGPASVEACRSAILLLHAEKRLLNGQLAKGEEFPVRGHFAFRWPQS